MADFNPNDVSTWQWLQFNDTRPDATERRNFTQRMPQHIIEQVINKAEEYNVDPNLALAVAVAESNMGRHSIDNPLRWHGKSNWAWKQMNKHGIPLGFADSYSGGPQPIDLAMMLLKKAQDSGNLQAYQGEGKYAYNKRSQPTSRLYGGNTNLATQKPYTSRVEGLQRVWSQMPEVQDMIQRIRYARLPEIDKLDTQKLHEEVGY